MRASIIVPTRNRASILALTLPYMLKQQVPAGDYEVLVVDDGSTDNTPSVVDQVGDSRVIYRRVEQGGASAARNRALDVARGDIVVFLDDDAFVAGDFLVRHVAAHEEAPNRLVAGGITETRAVPSSLELARMHQRIGYHRHPMPGGNASVRRLHLLAAGGFDEHFDSYGWQDQELAERLLRMGLVRRFAWGAAILHYKPANVVLDPKHELERELERGRMGARFYAKHPRTLVGITTKLWPPLRAIDRLLSNLLGLERTARRILAGEPAMGEFRGPYAALLRAHVEISAGRRELSRVRRNAERTSPAKRRSDNRSGPPDPPALWADGA